MIDLVHITNKENLNYMHLKPYLVRLGKLEVHAPQVVSGQAKKTQSACTLSCV